MHVLVCPGTDICVCHNRFIVKCRESGEELQKYTRESVSQRANVSEGNERLSIADYCISLPLSLKLSLKQLVKRNSVGRFYPGSGGPHLLCL